MSIYTKTGDKGKTALFGGKRVWKYDLQVEAYGITDEASCFIGLAIESMEKIEDRQFLSDIQMDLYSIMAYLSGASLSKQKLGTNISEMEKQIDSLDKSLPKLARFVLPQGSEATARLHIARAIVRSAERRIVEYVEQQKGPSAEDSLILQYINRLSDFLFMLARKFNSSETVT